MSENQQKLKLKRKKPSSSSRNQKFCTEESPETFTSFVPSAPSAPSTSAPCAPPTSASGGDGLWALTLHWVLQEIQDVPGPVPELPPPSAVTSSADSTDADWFLTDEVPPLPEYSFLQMCSESVMDISEPSQDTIPSPLPPLPPLSTPSPLPREPAPVSPPQQLTETPGPEPHRDRDQQRPGGTEGTGDTQRRGGTGGTQPTVRTEAAGETTGTGGAGGGLMQSCPLCLLPFPLGFTQLDRDSHLAQCLSEVNIDVTW